MIWQEIDNIRKRLANLQRRITRQSGKAGNHPILRCGTITAVGSDVDGTPTYTVQERNVDAARSDYYLDVYAVDGDIEYQVNDLIMFSVDNDGKRYILPLAAQRVVAVRDEDTVQCKHIQINETGTVSVPGGSETLDYQNIEPGSIFYNLVDTTKAGRIYLGMKRRKSDDSENFYLIENAGKGDAAITLTGSTPCLGADSLRIDIDIDGQGNVLDVQLAAMYGSSSSSSAGPTPSSSSSSSSSEVSSSSSSSSSSETPSSSSAVPSSSSSSSSGSSSGQSSSSSSSSEIPSSSSSSCGSGQTCSATIQTDCNEWPILTLQPWLVGGKCAWDAGPGYPMAQVEFWAGKWRFFGVDAHGHYAEWIKSVNPTGQSPNGEYGGGPENPSFCNDGDPTIVNVFGGYNGY